jgi:hypothetical protein
VEGTQHFRLYGSSNLVVGGLRGGSNLQAALESDSDLVHVKIRQNGQFFSVRNWEKRNSLG